MKLDFDIVTSGEEVDFDLASGGQQVDFELSNVQVVNVGGGGSGGLTRKEVVEIVKQVAVTQEKDPLVGNWAKSPNKPEYSYSEIKETPELSTVAITGSYKDLKDTPIEPEDGEDGITPHIGANDNWFIGEKDTGVLARGTNGVGIEKSEINADGALVLTYTNSNIKNVGKVVGQDGKSAYEIWESKSENANKSETEFLESLKGATGAKIVSTQLLEQDENGNNIYQQIFDNGVTATFIANRGPKGEPGPAGSISFSVVTSLPDEGNPNIMYLLQYSSTEGNMYYEYIYVEDKWELVGQTKVEVNLDDYVAKNFLTQTLEGYVKNSDFHDKFKSVITGSSNTLTDTEQKDAFKWLGIASAKESSLDNKLESATIIGAINELFNKVQVLEGFHSKVGSVYIGFTEYSKDNPQPLTSEQVKDTNYFTKYPLEDRSATSNPVLVSTTYQLSNIYLCIPKDKTFTSIVINAQGESLDYDVKKQEYTISIDGIDYSVYLNAKISAGTTKFNYTIQQGE